MPKDKIVPIDEIDPAVTLHKQTLDVDHEQFDNVSFADLQRLLDGENAVHISELDRRIQIEKGRLVGIPFILTSWKVQHNGAFGTYVVCFVTLADDSLGQFIDGSTGIKDQLMTYQVMLGGVKPIVIPKGLRASNYTYHDPELDKDIPATTYYFDNQS